MSVMVEYPLSLAISLRVYGSIYKNYGQDGFVKCPRYGVRMPRSEACIHTPQ